MKSNVSLEKTDGPAREVASYFGLTVEVIIRMRQCSLIAYNGSELIVNSEDLRTLRLAKAA